MTGFRKGRRHPIAAMLLSVSLAAAGPASAGVQEQAGSPTGSYLAGRFAQHLDDWSAAARYMSVALSADPNDIALLRRTFLLKLGEGQFDAALPLATRLMDRDGDPQMAITLLAVDHLLHDRLDRAEALAAAMPAEAMGKFAGPLLRAWLAAARGDTGRALDALNPLAAVTGFSALYSLHAALILDLGGRTEEAAARYAKVTESEAPLRVVHLVGNFLERTGHPEEARKLYDTFRAGNADSDLIEPALKALSPSGPAPAKIVGNARQGLAEGLFDLASALHHEGAEETALLFGRIALHLRPDLTLAQLMIGDIMEARGHQEDALAAFSGLSGDPVLGWTSRLRAADSLAQLGRREEAVAALAKLAAERPERTDAQIRLADLQRTGKNYAQAAEAYSVAIERIGTLKDRHWPLLYARAMSYDKIDRWPAAEADLQTAIALKPDEATLLNYLGYSWIDRGQNLDKAKAMVERAVELRPRDGYIVDSLGWALYRLGEYEGAVAKLERAIELKPLDPTINDHLGDAYWRVGRRNEARFQWNRALRNADEETPKEQIQTKLEKGLPETKAAEVKR